MHISCQFDPYSQELNALTYTQEYKVDFYTLLFTTFDIYKHMPEPKSNVNDVDADRFF